MAAPGLVLPVPARGTGVCDICHGPAARRDCYCCEVLLGRLGALAPVVPVGVCPVPGPWHTMLRDYKDAPTAGGRRRQTERLIEILTIFVADHAPCLVPADGHAQTPCTVLVPPGRHRGDPWPMAQVAAPALAAGLPPLVPALSFSGRAVEAPVPSGHLVAVPDAFTVDAPGRDAVRGRHVVLLDDSYTTGATAQSAAQALRRAGAAGVVVLVLARLVRPTVSDRQRAYWELVQQARRLDRPGSRSGPRSGTEPRPCAAGGCRWA